MWNEPASLLVYLFASIHYTNLTNVKTAEPIRPIFCGNSHDPKEGLWSQIKKNFGRENM